MISRATGLLRMIVAPSISAVNAGTGESCGLSGPLQGRARGRGLDAAHGDACTYQFVHGAQRRREGRGVECMEQPLGFIELADQQQAADLEMARMCCVQAIAVLFQRQARAGERLRWPAQIARDQREFALRHDAARPRHRFARAPNPRAAARNSSFAREKSPSCAIAMPRSASAGGSSRNATLFNAPSGSPAASARAPRLSRNPFNHRIPTNLSLPQPRRDARNA